jgi:hypothetical protein
MLSTTKSTTPTLTGSTPGDSQFNFDSFLVLSNRTSYCSNSVSLETCRDSTPYEAYWIAADVLEDDMDDMNVNATEIPTTTCVAIDTLRSEDDTVGAHNISYYISTGATEYHHHHHRCFAGSEMVTLSSGLSVPISEVAVGDSILAADRFGNTEFSEVIAVPHDKNAIKTSFVKLSARSGSDIMMTADHLILVEPTCSTSVPQLLAASAVKAGMCLVAASKNLDEVIETSTVMGEGIYTVVTKQEMVVVNGFVASPFAVNHAGPHAYYNVVRAVNSIVPGLMSWSVVKQANLLFDALVAAVSF